MPQRLLNLINDKIDTITAKLMYWFGVGSTAGGLGAGVVNDTFTTKLFTPDLWTIPDVAAIVGIFGGVSLVIQNFVNIYLSIKREQRESKKDK